MPLTRANPTTIEKRNPTSIELGGGALPPPTEVPGTPTFVLTALPASIFLSILRPQTGGRAMGYRYRLRRRNAADTAWESALAWVDVGTRRNITITQYSITQTIEVGRKYEVKVIAYNIIGDGTESAYQEVIPLTNIPAIPTFTLEPHDATIRLTLNKVSDPLNDPVYPLYNYFIEERNAADTAWVPDADGAQIITSDPFGAAGTHTIISDTDTQLVIDIATMRLSGQSSHSLINDRAYRIRVRSFNDVDYSAWSAYMSGTPMAGVMPAQLPGIPTFTFAPLRYAYDSTADTVSATINFNPRPNADGVGVTRWLFRYRESGTRDWTTQNVVAQPELDTVYGFRLPQSALGDTYELQVAGRNDAGDSAYTASQTILVARPLPQAPVWAFVYHPFIWGTALDFQLEPTDQLSPVLPITGYGWRFRIVGTQTWTTAESNISPFYASAAPSNAIGREIEAQMRSINAAGNSDWSASQTLQIIDVPDRPQIFLTAQPGGFDLRSVQPPSGYMATGGEFRYREGTSGDWTDGTSLQVRGLEPETLYQVEGWLTNPAGRGLSVFATVTTLAVMSATGRLAVYGDQLAVYGDDLKVYGG